MPGKYDTERDEALHRLCQEGWANESDGNVEAPTGYFWRITNTTQNVTELRDVLGEELPLFDDYHLLVGAFILREDTQGFIHVQEYPGQYPDRTGDDRARVAFQALQRAFAPWEADSE